MLNERQIKYLKEELEILRELAEELEKEGCIEESKKTRSREYQTYKIFDILLDIEGREIEKVL